MDNATQEEQLPAKLTFEDDSFDLVTVEFNDKGEFVTNSSRAAAEKKFKASLVDKEGALREFDCRVEEVQSSKIMGRWVEQKH